MYGESWGFVREMVTHDAVSKIPAEQDAPSRARRELLHPQEIAED